MKDLLRLAAQFLDEYADRLGNDGCNDWNWPEWLPAEWRSALVDPAYRSDFGDRPPPNWLAARRLASLLREESKK